MSSNGNLIRKLHVWNLIRLPIAVIHLREKHFEKSTGSTPVPVVRSRERLGNGSLELAEEPEVGDDPLAADGSEGETGGGDFTG
jgi:hypothetical protein